MARAPAETLDLLLEAGRLLSSKLDLGELLKSVLELSTRVVDAESASLLLLDEKTEELYFDVALGLGPEASKVRLPLGQGIAGSVAKDRKASIINDVRKDPRWSPKMDEKSGFVTRSILAVPMTLKGRLIGVVEAINKREGSFSPEDLHAFEAFASQAAVAIENARLFSTLREERHKLHTVFTEMTDGAVLADARGKILLANAAAHKFFGDDPVSLLSALKGAAVTPSFLEIMQSDSPAQDLWVVREQPKKLVLSGRATRINIGAGSGGVHGGAQASGWLCVLRDVTEEMQKEALKRTFLSLISHKLKTPLTAVTGFADLLLDEFREKPPDPMVLRGLETISAQSRKLSGLVDKLLNFTTLESPDTKLDLADCRLDEVIEASTKSLQAWLAENKASVSFKPSGVCVVGDLRHLTDVFKNLIENAVKFDTKPEKTVTVTVAAEPGKALVSVADSGPGIPPEDQEKVFSQFHQVEAYFTGQVDGWGLGLPFVKKVVGLHHGEVRLRSKLGEGTTVTVCLPTGGK